MAMVKLETSLGSIIIELDEKATPKTTQNFLRYVQEGFYDGTLFHRVIKGFMIQGGGFEAGLIQKKTHTPIENEAKSGLKNDYGTIAMARTNDPHSASSQFFINVAPNHFLNFKAETIEGYGYCAFGKVVEGMEVVLNISGVETTRRAGHSDVPTNDVYLIKAEQL